MISRRQLAGWLFFIGVFVLIIPCLVIPNNFGPFWLLFQFTFSDGGTAFILEEEGALFLFFVYAELIKGILFVLSAVALFFLYVNRRKIFPGLLVAFFFYNIVLSFIDVYASRALIDSPIVVSGMPKHLIMEAICLLVITPFLLYSRKSRNTFNR